MDSEEAVLNDGNMLGQTSFIFEIAETNGFRIVLYS